jgi:hypothetical protein
LATEIADRNNRDFQRAFGPCPQGYQTDTIRGVHRVAVSTAMIFLQRDYANLSLELREQLTELLGTLS